MGIASSLTALGLHRRLPYLLRLRAWIDQTYVEIGRRVALQDFVFRRRFIVRNRLNLRLLLDRTSIVDYRIIRGKGWESQQINRLFSYIEAFRDFSGKRYFLDLGAYWGLYSLIAHRRHWFDCIIAFEPDPLNRSQLHAQLALNFLANEIDVRSVALSDRVGLQPFLKSQCHSTGNRAGVSLLPESDGGKTILVPTDTLDNQLRIEDAVLFIKVDTEGHEINVLAGAEILLTKNQVVLQVECFQPNRHLIRPLLEKLGYRELGEIERDLYFTNLP
jgi:FkbM family methyltransferase